MRFRIWAVATAVAGLLVANGALAAQQWNMATAYPDPFFHTKNIHRFVKEIADASKGDLKITVHSAQSLYKLPEIHRAVQSGQIQMGETIVSLLANEDRVYEVDSLLVLRRKLRPGQATVARFPSRSSRAGSPRKA